MLVSALYIVVCRLLELVVLLGRRERAKELEILVLRQSLTQANVAIGDIATVSCTYTSSSSTGHPVVAK